MPLSDPFETFRWKREIAEMEKDFREKAALRRRRLEDLSAGEDDTVEFERQVASEMQDFLRESANSAERILRGIAEEGDRITEAEVEIRQKLESIIAGASAGPEEGEGRESAMPGRAGASLRRARAEARRPTDLSGALDRIRQHAGKPPLPAPAATQDGRPVSTRSRILATFDATCHQVSNLLSGEESVEVLAPLPAGGTDVRPRTAEAEPLTESTLFALLVEVRRIGRAVDALIRKGVLTEEDVAAAPEVRDPDPAG